MRDLTLYLEDIIKAFDAIENFINSLELEDLIEDDKTLSAVLWKFAIIGEAVKKIPNQMKDKYKEIPWKNMAGMRDRLIHAYFGIDYQLLWDTIKNEIPLIKTKLKNILKDLEKE